jgi:pyruvate dehydrogenase E1 component alpha subunit
MITKSELIKFEEDIGNLFNQKQIKAPIHLYNGNEDIMLEIFKKIDIKNDWVFCTWRNHYQALCKGIPENILKEKIIKGKSMVMNLPEYKFFCSSIVGGVTPIAMGTSLAIKLKKSTSKVWCFLGDMSAETGAFHESYKYSLNFDLPITWIIEDNFKSVLTPTPEVWGRTLPYYIAEDKFNQNELYHHNKIIYYRYQNNKYPHAGAGIRVQF